MSNAPTPDAESLAEPMRSRWSPTVFDAAHELDDEQLERLLQAARWAPSWGNSQPWSFIVLRRGEEGHADVVEVLSRGNAGWVPRASVLVLGITQVEPDADGETPGDVEWARYDLGQAVAHLTLQAQAEGLACHQFAGYDRDATTRALGLPAWMLLMAGVAIGMRGDAAEVDERDAAREQRERSRRDLDTFVHRGRWGVPWVPRSR